MNKNLQQMAEKLPGFGPQIAETVWGTLPADVRNELDLTLGAFTKITQNNPMAAADLIQLIKRQADPVLQPLTSIAVLGPVNAGKSTLFNALLAGTSEKAEVSPVPGTTKVNQMASVGLFSMIDTPGLDHGRSEGTQERHEALEAADDCGFLIMVFDASRSVTASDKVMYQQLVALGKPHLVVLNKMDLLPRNSHALVVKAAADVLGLSVSSIHAVSALKKQGLQSMLLEVAASEPRLLGEMGKVLTPLRNKLAWQAIRRAAVASCTVALVPLPVVDVIPLTVLQGTLVLTIARIYDQPMGLGRALDIAGSLGIGLAARSLFQQLSKLGGPPGWALSASIAGTATIIIGYSVMTWFETGVKPNAAAMRATSRIIQKKLLQMVKGFRKAKPNKQALEDELEKALPSVTDELEREAAPKVTVNTDSAPRPADPQADNNKH